MKQKELEHLRDCFIRTLTERNVSFKEEELNQWKEQLGIELCDTDSFCAVLKCSENIKTDHYGQYLMDLKNHCHKVLREEQRQGYVVIGCAMDVVLVLNHYSEYSCANFQAIADKLSKRMQSPIRMGIGKPYGKLTQIHHSMAEACEALEWSGAEVQVADIQDNPAGRVASNTEIRNNRRKVIEDFQKGSIGDLRNDLSVLAEQVRANTVLQQEAPYPSSIRRTMIEIMVEMLHIAADTGVDVDQQIGYVDPYRKIFELRNTPEIIQWITEQTQILSDAMRDRKKRMETTQLAQAKAFIQEHISDMDLSLTLASAHVGMSPSYFSAFFIREAGVGFKEYVTAERLSVARRLLRESRQSINAISEKCGFLTPSYFISVFKSQMGMTPGAYRKLKN